MTTGDLNKADLLYGVAAIGEFLGLTTRQAQHRIDGGDIPVFRMGTGKRARICARRTTLREWLARIDREARNAAD